MNSLPSSSLHHSFDINLAKTYGIEEAILIHHIAHWVNINRRKRINFQEGRTWTFMTYQDIADHFPYLSYDQVRRTIKRLVDKHNVILKGSFNRKKGDSTVWFSFHDEERFVPFSSSQEKKDFYEGVAKSPGGWRNRQGGGEIASALPYTKQDTEKKKKEREGASTPRAHFFKREEHVETTEKEHEELLKRIGEAKATLCYKRLSEWKLDTPRSKWKKSDYRSILRWVIKAVEEDAINQAETAQKSSKTKRIAHHSDIETNKELGGIMQEFVADYKKVEYTPYKMIFRLPTKGFEKHLAFDIPNHVFIETANQILTEMGANFRITEEGIKPMME